jgi:hypothetical protein
MAFDQQAALFVLEQMDEEIDWALASLDKDDKEALRKSLRDAENLVKTLRVLVLEADDGDATDPE